MQEQNQCIDIILNEIRHMIDMNNRDHIEARKRGEEYNIFEILGLQYSELNHSAFIANLLNPKGSHGLGKAPIRSFLKILNITSWNDLDIGNAEVDIEVSLNSENENERGRMDIVLKSNNKIIIIENKVYAGDQHKQLRRYNTYAEKYFQDNHILVYLTLDGHDASSSSTDGLYCGKDYILASYKHDIWDWINDCLRIALQRPLVREVLMQYQRTINNLVGNSLEESDKNKIYDYILQNGKKLIPIFTSNAYHTERRLIEGFCKSDFFQFGLLHLKNELIKIAKRKYLICEFDDVFSGGRYCGFSFRHDGWDKSIMFQFTQFYWKGCYYGVHTDDPVAPGVKMPHLKYRPNNNYCYGHSYTDYKNWDIRGIITGEIKDSIIKALDSIINIINLEPGKYAM